MKTMLATKLSLIVTLATFLAHMSPTVSKGW